MIEHHKIVSLSLERGRVNHGAVVVLLWGQEGARALPHKAAALLVLHLGLTRRVVAFLLLAFYAVPGVSCRSKE